MAGSPLQYSQLLRDSGEAASHQPPHSQLGRLLGCKMEADNNLLTDTDSALKVGPYILNKNERGQEHSQTKYSFESQTISENIRKIIR